MNVDHPTHKDILRGIANGYNSREDFDRHIYKKAGQLVAKKVEGMSVLEMGCANGLITDELMACVKNLDIVDAVEEYTSEISKKWGASANVFTSLFEEFKPPRKYEAICFANTLHHIHEPQKLLKRVMGWLVPGGRLYITVPNALSLHRRIGVLMGLLKDPFDASERNIRFDQPGRYIKETLVKLVSDSGFEVVECFGFFLKPFSHEQMERLNPSQEMIDALFEIGKTMEEYASLIFLEAAKPIHQDCA